MECEGNGRGVVIDRQARLKDGRRAAKRPKAEHRSKGSRNMTAHFPFDASDAWLPHSDSTTVLWFGVWVSATVDSADLQGKIMIIRGKGAPTSKPLTA